MLCFFLTLALAFPFGRLLLLIATGAGPLGLSIVDGARLSALLVAVEAFLSDGHASSDFSQQVTCSSPSLTGLCFLCPLHFRLIRVIHEVVLLLRHVPEGRT